MCSITTSQRLRLWQMDFVSAFLNSSNLFEVYIEQPRDFEKERDDYIYRKIMAITSLIPSLILGQMLLMMNIYLLLHGWITFLELYSLLKVNF